VPGKGGSGFAVSSIFTSSVRLLSFAVGNQSPQPGKRGVLRVGWCLLRMRAGNQDETNLSSSTVVMNLCMNRVFRGLWNGVLDEDREFML